MATEARPTYRISTYDPGDGFYDDFEWNVRASGLPLMRLRRWLTALWRCGYDTQSSILVERED